MLTLRNAAPMCVASTVVLLLVSLMAPLLCHMNRVKGTVMLPPPPQLPVRALSAASREQPVTSGMDSPSVSARIGVRRNPTSPVHRMASPISTAAIWMQKLASGG